MKPFFSIIIPVYNKENFVSEAIKSALYQSFDNFEIIIVNDGSTDNSLKAIETIHDTRIRVYSIINQGVSAARNFGIANSNANFICLLDADDTWKPDHLETLKNLISEFPDCGLFTTGYEKKHATKTIQSIYNNIPLKPWSGIIENYFDCSLINSIAWISTSCIPKSIFDDVGYFDTNITLGAGEDTDLWIRIALKHKVAFNNKVTGTHNLFTENRLSNSNTNNRKFLDLDKYENYIDQYKNLKKYLDLNRFSIALKYRAINNQKKAKKYIDQIDSNSLNFKQKVLLGTHPNLLRMIKSIQSKLIKSGIYLTPFR